MTKAVFTGLPEAEVCPVKKMYKSCLPYYPRVKFKFYLHIKAHVLLYCFCFHDYSDFWYGVCGVEYGIRTTLPVTNPSVV